MENKTQGNSIDSNYITKEQFNEFGKQLETNLTNIVNTVNNIGDNDKVNAEKKFNALPKHEQLQIQMNRELEVLNDEERIAVESIQKKYFDKRKSVRESYKGTVDIAYSEYAERKMEKYEQTGEVIGKVVGKLSKPIFSMFSGIAKQAK